MELVEGDSTEINCSFDAHAQLLDTLDIFNHLVNT